MPTTGPNHPASATKVNPDGDGQSRILAMGRDSSTAANVIIKTLIDGTVVTTAAGGAGAASLADGADVAEGATTDAAIITDAAGTVSGKLRGMVKILADVWDSAAHVLKISAAALPLPTGASTAAKQPALGTAGTPSADVLTVQGAVAGTVLPVSGTVTVQQGTSANLKGVMEVADSGGATVGIAARSQSPTGNAMQVQIGPGDVISNLPVVIDYDHHQLHEGETFRWSVYTASLGNGANKDIQLVVPSISGVVSTATAVQKCPHFRFEVVSSADANVQLYEGPTISVAGTARTPIALERNGTYTPKLQILEDPTNTALGTLIWQGMLTGSKNAAGSIDTSLNEFILKNNTTYLIRAASLANSNRVLIRLVWYEDLGV